MPMSVTRTEGRTTSTYPLSPDSLPIELYFKIVFDDPRVASRWCTDAATSFSKVSLGSELTSLQRLVVWGPSAPSDNWVSGGNSNVFVSELALRIVRALGELRVPGAEPVALSQLEYNLRLYVGSASDQRAYDVIRRH